MRINLVALEKKIYPALRRKQMEVALVPPQTLGPLTLYYHRFIPALKVAPWRLILLSALLTTIILRLALGPWFVRLATLLQRGF